jgi:tetratricopeptide (TPR) repeat protein
VTKRAHAWAVFVIPAIALGPIDAAEAGTTPAAPPVRVVVPHDASGNPLEPDDLPGPQPEVVKAPAKVEVPAVPGFELPAAEAGFHGPRELRVRGRSLLGTEIKVRGYVTAIYDCAAELTGANPRATRAQIAAAIEKDPSLCERPMFFLGDARSTSRDASIWVVDVPQPPSKAAHDGRPKDQPKVPAVPRLAVGDYVVVTGTWAIQSPYAAHNSDGLLVYKALEPAVASAANDSANAGQELSMEIELDSPTRLPLRPVVDDVTRNTSVDHLNACNKALAARQYDAAITECQTATTIWNGNHLAWYAWASAHMAKGEWTQAKAAVEHAVALRPDQGMYQLYYGMSLYETERQEAREDQARKENKKPDEVTIDPAVLKLDAARDALVAATKLAPELWRAHYYLGRIYRDLDDARHAAEQFTRTIKTHPAYRFSYIALIELYRRWDYLDQALAVATLGTTNVPAADAAQLWFEVGMTYDAKHAEDQAIDAFTRAISSKPDDASAKFQRGQIYFRKGDLDKAKRDLEEVVTPASPLAGPAKQFATQLLAQIAANLRAPPSGSRTDGDWGSMRIRRRPVFRWRDAAKFRIE